MSTRLPDRIIEAAGGGTDTVYSTISYMLAAQLDNLELVGSGDMDGQGNALDNRLVGNEWANALDGGTGADTLVGNDGDDTYTVDNAGDTVIEAPGGGNDLGAQLDQL